jgi:PKD repeat protein
LCQVEESSTLANDLGAYGIISFAGLGIFQQQTVTKECKVKRFVETVGKCRNNECYAEETPVANRTTEVICEYGCEMSPTLHEANCKPDAVIASNPEPGSETATLQLAPLSMQPPSSGAIDIKEGESVDFNCYNSVDPDGSIAECRWDFGDGSAEEVGMEVTHVFTTEGSYIVTLTVVDDAGLTDTAQISVNVLHENQPPVADFTVNPTSGTVGMTEFSFDASASYDPDGFIVKYEWDFGDTESMSGADKVNVTHRYSHSIRGTEGVSVTLRVEDNEGAVGVATKQIVVINNAPDAKFSAIPLRGINPLTVVFTAKATDPDGHKIVKYEWDFDNDGVVDSTDQDVIYTYDTPGRYTATLVVEDEFGARSMPFSVEIEVYELTGIKNLRASNVAVGQDTVIYIECAGTDKVDLTISNSDGSFSTTLNDVLCNSFISYGPMETAGVYTVTARVPGCNTLECTKSTTFNVFEEVSQVETPEMNPLVAILLAGIIIVVVRNKKE